MLDFEVIDEELINCPENKSPIFYVNISAQILMIKSKKITKYHIEKVVVKGTIEQIKKSKQTKIQFLKRIFEGRLGIKKKINDFDLNRIKILDIEIIKGLGYGVKLE